MYVWVLQDKHDKAVVGVVSSLESAEALCAASEDGSVVIADDFKLDTIPWEYRGCFPAINADHLEPYWHNDDTPAWQALWMAMMKYAEAMNRGKQPGVGNQ